MTGPLPDGYAERVRLARYKAAHPGVIIEDLGFGTVWQARIATPGGETVFTRRLLRDLLDRLDEHNGAAPEPPDSG